jgi:hypothetical protein
VTVSWVPVPFTSLGVTATAAMPKSTDVTPARPVPEIVTEVPPWYEPYRGFTEVSTGRPTRDTPSEQSSEASPVPPSGLVTLGEPRPVARSYPFVAG